MLPDDFKTVLSSMMNAFGLFDDPGIQRTAAFTFFTTVALTDTNLDDIAAYDAIRRQWMSLITDFDWSNLTPEQKEMFDTFYLSVDRFDEMTAELVEIAETFRVNTTSWKV